MKITFYPSRDDKKLADATKEYQHIWDSEGQDIIHAIEHKTGFTFEEKQLNAIVFEGVSQSHPLALRASYDEDTKKATIVHELLHRICAYKLNFPDENDGSSMSLHKVIYLVLYEIWAELYGEDFAKKEVQVESSRTDMYKESWKWALSMSQNERLNTFEGLKIQS